MIIIEGRLISEDLFEKNFVCNLSMCKGACCWEGDFGAPLKNDEISLLNDQIEKIIPYLSETGMTFISENGISVFYKGMDGHGTPLLPDGSCAFVDKGIDGIALCGIELACSAGATLCVA